MNSEEELLKHRFEELSIRAAKSGRPVFSDFLGLSGQEILKYAHLSGECELFGGYDSAERRIARFGESYIDYPIVCIKISPKSMKYSDSLTHRDFLGSLIALGLKREVLGDIIVNENSGYLFCHKSVSEFILSELKKVKHTDIIPTLCTEPPLEAAIPEEESVSVASERLDCMTAAVFKLSRNAASELISCGKVLINGRECFSGSQQIKEGDTISVRGSGRFVFTGIIGETRKGKRRAAIKISR